MDSTLTVPAFAHRSLYLLVACLALPCAAAPLAAQTRPAPVVSPPPTDGAAARRPLRPLPGPIYETPEFSRAVEGGTRTRTGRPGADYWTQYTRYDIDARLDPATQRVSGEERVTYLNHSPDTLTSVAVHLRQNVFEPSTPRRDDAPITDGMRMERIVVGGVAPPEDAVEVEGTVMTIDLAEPLVPGDSLALEFAWSFEVPPKPSDGRQGREGDVYYIGYWYPQLAVYDDVHGWVADPYTLRGEFYMGYADYDVRLTVPWGWTVGATGTLRNAAEVLTPGAREKLADARRSGDVVRMFTPGDDPEEIFAGNGDEDATVTWHYTTSDIRDFAWTASDEEAWDATRALVDRDGRDDTPPDTVDIHSFFRLHDAAAAWPIGGARYTADAIEQLSAYLWPYPWPTMTSVEGILTGGGMEYPMMTVMRPWADTLKLAGDLMHETGHMWFPMMVGSNEKRVPWMDEGLTQFDVAQAMRPLYGEAPDGGRPNDSEVGQRMLYMIAAQRGYDWSLMWPGEQYPPFLYSLMFYDKTAQVLATLRTVIGEETFHRALREYGRRWEGGHPYPFDFFNTFDDVAGQDLEWFWRTWFFEPWSLDQAIGGVHAGSDSTAITVEDVGLAPMPVRLEITRADGSTERLEIPVDVWMDGARSYTLRVPSEPMITKIVIDPDELFPDIDRSNQFYIVRDATP